MNITILGGLGYVGQRVAHYLNPNDYNIKIIDAGWFEKELKYPAVAAKVPVTIADIRDLKSGIFNGQDLIIHLANVANDPVARIDPKLSWHVNVLGTKNVLEEMKQSGVKNMVFFSSGSVYGISDEANVTEESALVPITEYNRTKMIAEDVIHSYHRYGINTTIIRPGTICGVSERQRWDLSVNMLTKKAFENKKIVINGGSQMRPHVNIRDILRLIKWITVLKAVHGQVFHDTFNICNEVMSMAELGRMVSRITDVPWVIDETCVDSRSYRMSAQKLKEKGFVCKFTVEHAIKELITSYTNEYLERKTEDKCLNTIWMKKTMLDV